MKQIKLKSDKNKENNMGSNKSVAMRYYSTLKPMKKYVNGGKAVMWRSQLTELDVTSKSKANKGVKEAYFRG